MISSTLLQEMLTKGNEIMAQCSEGLPEGAAFVRSYYVPEKAAAVMIYEHSSFPELEEGQDIPNLDVLYISRWPK